MNLVMDLLQVAGIAVAIGIRPLLPVLLVGALASGDLGVDFDGTDYAFLEAPGFLAGVFAALVAQVVYEQRRGRSLIDDVPLLAVAFALAALAALEGSGSLADRDHPVGAGIAAGAVCAMVGLAATRRILPGARRRLEAQDVAGLAVYAEAAALTVAGASVLFPPLAAVVLIVLAALLVRGRRQGEQKYAGLRILR